jgi:hypothetical protein
MSRCLLHITKLDAFKEWLDKRGIQHRPGKGFYQVIQVCKNGKHWNNVYTRHHMPEHFTTDRHLDSLVSAFCKETP